MDNFVFQRQVAFEEVPVLFAIYYENDLQCMEYINNNATT